MDKRTSNILYLLSSSIIALLIVPNMLQQGLFMDGLQYACVSRNYANGVSSFWYPFLANSWWYGGNQFLEHPPLFYFVESLFFNILGSGFYTEKIFGLCLALLNGYLIKLCWEQIALKFNFEKGNSWFSILIWIVIPINFWAYQNNAIEMLVTSFDLLAFLFCLHALISKKSSFLYLVISGFFIFLASLTKGIPALFPLSVIPIYFIFHKNEISFFKTTTYTFVIILIPILIYAVLLLFYPVAANSLEFYVKERLLNRIQNPIAGEYRLFSLFAIAQELIPAIIICIFILILNKSISFNKKETKVFFFLLFIGLSGVLPLMLTLVQKKFYFVPALPFFALAFTALLNSKLSHIANKLEQNRIAQKVTLLFSILVIIGSLSYAVLNFGKFCRDAQDQNDIAIIGKEIKNQTSVSIQNSDFNSDWNLHFYLIRNYNIDVAPDDGIRKFLITSTEIPDSNKWNRVSLPTKKYKLYSRK